MVAGADGTATTITREYGLSHADLARILPRLTTARLEVIAGDYVFAFADGRRLTLSPGAQQTRQIASLRIPYLQATFCFAGWESAQIEEFFTRFDRAFQKGGG